MQLEKFFCVCFIIFFSSLSILIAEEKPDFSKVPGNIITYRPASGKKYLGSPGLLKLPDGTLLAKCDEFGPATTEHVLATSFVYKSKDGGKTWSECAVLPGFFWASIYLLKNEIYMIGTTRHHGDIVITKSTDQGDHWTKSESATTGLITEGGQYHTAPMPCVIFENRFYRAFEDASNGLKWGRRYSPMVISASLDSDLLQRDSWTKTDFLKGDPAWLNGKFNGWLEGNLVIAPDGKFVDILRVDCPDNIEKAAIVTFDREHQQMVFDPEKDFINFPGGAKKFTIRFDAVSKRYWSLVNWVPVDKRITKPASTRNTQAIASSADLKNWTVHKILLEHPDQKNHGFQYVDWLFDGEDIIYMSRTAYEDGIGGAHNNHDANFMTFHRCEQFRSLQKNNLAP